MAKKPIHIITCDRCNREMGRAEIDEDKSIPAYYRQIQTVGEDGKLSTTEAKLDHLCKRCKGEVEELDSRIFSDSRVRRAGDESSTTNDNTTNETETKTHA